MSSALSLISRARNRTVPGGGWRCWPFEWRCVIQACAGGGAAVFALLVSFQALAGELGATTVYRCGPDGYAQRPCGRTRVQPLVVEGEISADRQAQAWRVAQRESAPEARPGRRGKGDPTLRAHPNQASRGLPPASVIPVHPVSVGPQPGASAATSKRRGRGAQAASSSTARAFVARVPQEDTDREKSKTLRRP